MELKIESNLKKKDRLVRKKESKFGEGARNDDEDEEEE